MVFKHRLAGLAAALLCLSLTLAACGKKEAASSVPASSEPTPTVTAPTFVSVDIHTLLTVEEVSQIAGEPVGEPEEYENGTALRYYTGDPANYLELQLMDATEEDFNAITANYEDMVDAPNLGQTAKWSAEQRTLLVFEGQYVLGCVAQMPGTDDSRLILAREMMSKALEKLHG